MINQIRTKFIAMFLVFSTILLAVVMISINVSMQRNSNKQIEEQLKSEIMDDHQEIGPGKGTKLPIKYAIFMVSGEQLIVYDKSQDMEQDELYALADEVPLITDSKGTIDNYRYIVVEDRGYTFIAFGNDQIQQDLVNDLLKTTLIVGIISIILITGLITYVSRYVTKPTEIMIEKQKDFVANSSHELKIPLAVISAKTDLLEIEYTKETVAGIKKEVSKMDNVIKDLLYISKLDSMSKNVEAKMSNISLIVERVMLDNELLVFEKNKILKYEIEENIHTKVVETQITRLLEELLDNAIKYSDVKTDIIVKLYIKNKKLHLSIFNKGIGIDIKDIEKIFERFYRVNTKGKSEIDGSGVGLSIVKTIADLNDISINVESNGKDQTTFMLTFSDFKKIQ